MENIKAYNWPYILWPTIALPSVLLIGFEVYLAFHPDQDFGLALLQIALLVLWFFIVTVRGILALINSQPKKLISFALSFLFLWPTSVILNALSVGDYLRFATEYSHYQSKIATSPNTRHDFKWGGTGFAGGPSSDKFLIYDPLDKLPQENKKRDAQWKSQFYRLEGKQKVFKAWIITKPLWGHFYSVEEFHQA